MQAKCLVGKKTKQNKKTQNNNKNPLFFISAYKKNTYKGEKMKEKQKERKGY